MECPFSHDNRMSKDLYLSLIGYNELSALVYLHKSFTLELVQVVSSAVQPFPLRVEDGVGHLPPGPTVEQQCQAHHTSHAYQHGIYCQVIRVHLVKIKALKLITGASNDLVVRRHTV